jgi:hypothetical protein
MKTFKNHFTTCVLLAILSQYAVAQVQLTETNFEQEILAYVPVQKSRTPKKDFDFASMVIRETKTAVKGDPDGFNRADYFNILIALLSLDESPENIDLAFTKFAESEGACEYFEAFKEKVNSNDLYAPVRSEFNARAKACAGKEKPEFNVDAYIKERGLNEDLVLKMASIDARDKKYRNTDYDANKEEQRALDRVNQQQIYKLYDQYGAYLGTSMVGPKYEATMWSVIQHSNLEMMKQFLPVLHEAVKNKELAPATLKMTIDRVYAFSEGKQIFGSQQGVPVVDEERREAILNEYPILKESYSRLR